MRSWTRASGPCSCGDQGIPRAASTDLAAADWERLERSGLDRIHFTWAGGTERGQGHNYRVQGGTFVLEYDNTQNHANHVHSVWRDFAHDFGADLLKGHYLESHTK
jgi:hypothetical protein